VTAEEVYTIVREIPYGRVATYGQVAFLAGSPRNARQVGKLMSAAHEGVPAHRVVNSQGRTAPGWAGQRELLEAEGVGFLAGGNVNLKKFVWREEG